MKKIIALILALILAVPMFSASASGDKLTFLCEPVANLVSDIIFVGDERGEFNARTVYYDGLGAAVKRTDASGENAVGILGTDGKIVIPAEYSRFGGIVDGKYVLAHKKTEGDKYSHTLFDFGGNVVIAEGKYEGLSSVYGTDMMVAVKDNKCGVITADEKVKVPFEYDGITGIGGGYFSAKKGEKYGVVDSDGKTAVPFEYSAAIEREPNGMFYTRMGFENNTLIGADGKVIDEGINYAEFSESGYTIRKGTDSVKYNADGTPYKEPEPTELEKTLLEKGYELVKDMGDYYIVALKGRKYSVTTGALDKNFNLIVPTEFEFITPIEGTDYMSAKPRDEALRYFDKSGNELENNYKVHPMFDGFFISPEKGADRDYYPLVDSDGKVVIPGAYGPSHKLTYCREYLYLLETADKKVAFLEKNGTGKNVTDYVPGLRLKIDSKDYKIGSETAENDVAPVIKNGRTMLPARLVAETLGCTVEWNPEKSEIKIIKDGAEQVSFTVGSDQAVMYKVRPYKLDAAPFIENGRTYVPVRSIASAVGARIYWNAEEKTVDIIK